jgi:hypothetical protein
MDKEIKWIVAGNYKEYIDYLGKKLYDPRIEYRYVNSADSLKGCRPCHGYYIGNYFERPDIEEIRERILINNT